MMKQFPAANFARNFSSTASDVQISSNNARWRYWRCFLFRVKEVGYADRAPNVIRKRQLGSIAPASWRTPLRDDE
jgi:hypothetical protein